MPKLKARLLLFAFLFLLTISQVWLVKSGNFKAFFKTNALDCVFSSCPFGFSQTVFYKLLRPEGMVSNSVLAVSPVFLKGYYLAENNPSQSVSQNEPVKYMAGKTEEETTKAEETQPQIKPIIAVNLKTNSQDGYLTFQNVLAKNTSDYNINLLTLLKEPLKYKISKATKGPQVLIYHTHATEGFNLNGATEYKTNESPRSENDSENIVAVGNVMEKLFTAKGIKTIHSETHHDSPDYTTAYNRSLETANAALKKYPSIKIVLDIHRDSLINSRGEKYRPVIQIDGKNAAQIMIIAGVGNNQTPNTHYKENLKTAVLIGNKAEKLYKGLTRPILIRENRYNSNVSEGAILIEIGSCGNTIEEVKYSGELMANVITQFIKEREK